MVWACRLSVEAYAEAGKDIVVPRPRCPACRAWCGRHRQRARVALVVGLTVAASLGVRVDVVAASVEAAALSALEIAVSAACETEGLARWSAVSLVTQGMWLGPVGPTRSRVF